MARLFLLCSLAFAITTAIHFGVGVASALAQHTEYPDVCAAREWLDKGETQKALASLKIAARKNPELASAHVMLYELLLKRNDPSARFELELGIRDVPNDPEPYLILGDIALDERRFAEAALDYEKADQLLRGYINVDRKGPIEYLLRSRFAQLAEKDERWKQAETLLRDAIKFAPEDLILHQRLAHAMFWQGEASDAYGILKKAKAIDRARVQNTKTPETVVAPEAIMGQYYEQLGGGPLWAPRRWFEAAIKKSPDDLCTREAVAHWALETGNVAFAKEQAEAALRIEAADPVKYGGSSTGDMLRGLVALSEKNWPEAEKRFEAVLRREPSSLEAKCNLVKALIKQEDPAKAKRAEEYAKASYFDNPAVADILPVLACVYIKRCQFDHAWLVLQFAGSATGENVNPDTATCLAHVLYHQKKNWKAKELLEIALKNYPPFFMKPEAETLYEKVKDAQKPIGSENSKDIQVSTPVPPETP